MGYRRVLNRRSDIMYSCFKFCVENVLCWVGGKKANKLEAVALVKIRDTGGLSLRFYSVERFDAGSLFLKHTHKTLLLKVLHMFPFPH